MSKKAYIILGALLLLIVIAGASLAFLSKKKSTTTTSPSSPSTTATTPDTSTPATTTTSGTSTTGTSTTGTTAAGSSSSSSSGATTDALARKTTDQVISPILSFQGNEVWYFTAAGNLEQLDLSSANLKGYVLPKALTVSSAIWPSQGSDFIIASNNSDGTKTYNYYSSTNKQFTTYPPNVKQVEFMPSGNQVIYIWNNNNGTSSLTIADPDLSNHKQLLASMPEANDVLAVSPLGDHVLIYDPTAPSNNKLYVMALSDTKLHAIKTGPVNAGLWSNDGQHFVFNKYNTANAADATLWLGSVSNAKSDISLGISVPITKLAFDTTGATLYYGAPDSTSTSGTSLVPADSLWSYAVSTGSKTEIFSGNTYSLDVSNLLISNDGKSLYFKNGDGYLYGVTVKK